MVIVVNVASGCGLTNSNYKQLKVLQDKYHDRGNQFGGQVGTLGNSSLLESFNACLLVTLQEPDCAIDVIKFVKEKFNYEPDLYGKINVNGDKVRVV